MMYDLDALVSQARNYLVGKDYAHSTIAHHEAAWKRLRSWCENEDVECNDHDVEQRFIEEVVMSNANATKYFKLDRRLVLLLLSIEETGGPPERRTKRKFVVPPGFDAAYGAYAADLDHRGLKPVTQDGALASAALAAGAVSGTPAASGLIASAVCAAIASLLSSIHWLALGFSKSSGSSSRKRAIHAYIVDSGTLFSAHQSLIIIVVDRHCST